MLTAHFHLAESDALRRLTAHDHPLAGAARESLVPLMHRGIEAALARAEREARRELTARGYADARAAYFKACQDGTEDALDSWEAWGEPYEGTGGVHVCLIFEGNVADEVHNFDPAFTFARHLRAAIAADMPLLTLDHTFHVTAWGDWAVLLDSPKGDDNFEAEGV